MRCRPTVFATMRPMTIAQSTYSMSGTDQCSRRATEFHQICAYFPSKPMAINSKTPGTYSSRLRLLKLSCSGVCVWPTRTAFTVSPTDLRKQARHREQDNNAGHDRGPPVNADPAHHTPLVSASAVQMPTAAHGVGQDIGSV